MLQMVSSAFTFPYLFNACPLQALTIINNAPRCSLKTPNKSPKSSLFRSALEELATHTIESGQVANMFGSVSRSLNCCSATPISSLPCKCEIDQLNDEAGAAAMKTIELDAALGVRAIQYRDVHGHKTESLLSYFKPCIIPEEGGTASGFTHVESEEHKIRMFTCQGKHVVHVKEVPFARSSLNHDYAFVLDRGWQIDV